MAVPSAGDVFVDLLFDDGFLFFVLANQNDHFPATKVRVAFGAPVIGIDGTDIAELAIFKQLSWLAPSKRIPVLIDSSSSFFSRRRRARITLSLLWTMDGQSFKSEMGHDTRVYKDLPHLLDRHRPHAT